MSSPPLKYCFGFPILTALLSVSFLTVSGLAVQPPLQTVRWETDLNVAVARAEREQRPLFLHFVGNDGASVQQMGGDVFAQPNIAAHVNANFVMVRINAVENPALAQRFSVTAVPTDLIMRSNGQIVHRRVGAITADRFTAYLTFLQNDILAGGNQPPAQVSATPPLVASPFPGTNPVNPQNSFQPVPPQAATPPLVASPFPGVNPVNPQGPFQPVPPTTVQHSPVPHQPFAQHQPAVMGATVAPAAPTHNPLRTTETAARPAWEQNIGTTSPPTPPPAANMQAMLAEPAPTKRTIEVPLALEGFCPVMLLMEERWVAGNPAYSTMFQGHVFRFSSMEALVTFAQNPANYMPVAMGEDIVLKVDRNRRVNGDRQFGAWFQGRVFLFSSQESFNAFEARPNFYAEIALQYEIARREQPMPIVY